jgi:hypothetical protein
MTSSSSGEVQSQQQQPPPHSPPPVQIVVRDVSWRDVLPWTHLFRAFRVAVHPSKLMLAWVMVLLLYLGGRILDAAWGMTRWGEDGGIFLPFFKYEALQVKSVARGVLAWNWDFVFESIRGFIVTGPVALFKGHPLYVNGHPLYAVLLTFWFLLLWAVFGGAIARIAAVHVAREEKMSVRQAIRFSSGKMLSFIFAPLIPMMILGALGVVLGAAGWVLMHVPWIGPILLGVFFILALVIGAIMALVVLGTAGGFNLMYPTIAVEGSDSFDAISRSFSYAYARPWRLVWYTLVSVAYGAVCYLFVRYFIFLLLGLTHYFVGWWLGDQSRALADWRAIWPLGQYWEFFDHPVHLGDAGGGNRGTQVASWFVTFWVYLVISLLGAFVISFYFSANTIIYGLLRREVDATDLDDVYVEESEEEFSEAPPAVPEKVAGTAGPIAGVPTSPPTGGDPRGATGLSEGLVEQDGPDKAGPAESRPGGDFFTNPDET